VMYIYELTRGKNDWIREIGPRSEVCMRSIQVSEEIVSTGPVGYGVDELRINPAR